jgi:CRISPR/Cas system-associated endoribonuclease Cas2
LFVAEESDHGIRRIRDELIELINSKTDDVRIYPLPKNLELHQYGRGALPEGLQLLVDRENRHTGLFNRSLLIS